MKTIHIEDIGDVIIRKSSRAKRLILRINADGKPTATIPSYMLYFAAEKFVRGNISWIRENMQQKRPLLQDGMRIGREHFIYFLKHEKSSVKSRVSSNAIHVYMPSHANVSDSGIQEEAVRGAIRALRKEAEVYVPPKLHQLAINHGYTYSEVRIKATQTRWGSCSQKKIINLSIWLMQLPDDLVEYVICHELTHLHHMHHQKAFWEELSLMIPDYKLRRAALKQFQPTLTPKSS